MGVNLRLSGAQTSPREESDIRYNYTNLSQIIAASTQLGGTQPMHYSMDGGATWRQSSLPAFTGDARQGDPTIDWTSDGTAWSITIGISPTTDLVLRCFKSVNAGATWTFDSTLTSTQTAMDKEALWIDHSQVSRHKDNMYATWHNNRPCFVARRTGPTGTWQAPVQVSGAETTGTALGGDIKTNSRGDVFVFWPDTGSQNLFVAKSTDGGVTFASPVSIAKTFGALDIGVPAQDNRKVLIYLSGGAFRMGTEDLVYATWTDLAGRAGCNGPGDQPGSNTASPCKTRIWFSRSTDGGVKWEAARKLNDQDSVNDQFFQRLAVDDTTGELLVVYYDTVNDPGRLKTDLWMQGSTDGGLTWSSAVQVTSAETDETSAGAESDFQYGDYIGLTGHAGQFFACWTDRRNGRFEEIWGAPITRGVVRRSPAVFGRDLAANTKSNYVVTSDGRLAQLWDTDRWNLDFPAELGGQPGLRFQGSPAVFGRDLAANTKSIYVVTSDGRLAQLWDTDRWNLDFPAELGGQPGLRFQGSPAVFGRDLAANTKSIYVVTSDGRLAQLWDTDRWNLDFPAELGGQPALRFEGAV